LNLDLVNLVLLQKLDYRLEALLKAQDEGPQRLARLDEELAAAQQQVADANQLEQDLIKRRRELEAENEDAEQKLKANQARQLQVKTNEEYRALLKENEFMRKANAARDDELLELMDRIESQSKEVKTLASWLEERQAEIEKEKEEIQKRLEKSKADVEKVQRERQGLLKDIPRRYLSMYDRVYPMRNGKAVAPVAEGICQECFLQIPPQQYNELQRNEELMSCPHCQRIIFFRDHQDFEDIDL
jgi:hypothetical protein